MVCIRGNIQNVKILTVVPFLFRAFSNVLFASKWFLKILWGSTPVWYFPAWLNLDWFETFNLNFLSNSYGGSEFLCDYVTIIMIIVFEHLNILFFGLIIIIIIIACLFDIFSFIQVILILIIISHCLSKERKRYKTD